MRIDNLWPPDVSSPRDRTHCAVCRRRFVEGDYVISSSKPVNRRPPYKYRTRVEHYECNKSRVDESLRRKSREQAPMTTKTVGKVKLTEKDGKVKLTRVRKFDASKARRIAKSKTKRVVAPAKARAAR